ncbi:MAG TPA: serine protein kinase RIO, partial [Marinobacter adhaerens]|nr:serine protein kinase RIO [Marinobacter adhaerens]
GDLHPDSKLTGCFQHDDTAANVDELMEIIDAAKEEEWERQERMRDAEED